MSLGQSLEQQYGQADAELNRVYSDISSKLTDPGKKELQAIQKNWIAERDTAANSATSQDQKYKILTTKTIDRTAALKNMLSIVDKDTKIVAQLEHISSDIDEQYKQAEKELNQVYNRLMVTLNDEEKQQLKVSQREWIKQREDFAAQDLENPNRARLQSTNRRLKALDYGRFRVLPIPQIQVDVHGDEKEVYPMPQVNDQDVITCKAASEDNSVIAVGHRFIVTVWTKNREFLIRTINFNAAAMRIIPTSSILIMVGMQFDPENPPTATTGKSIPLTLAYYNIKTGLFIAKFDLLTRDDGFFEPYITEDAKKILLYSNFDDEKLFYECKIPHINTTTKLLEPTEYTDNQSLLLDKIDDVEKVKIRYPEIKNSLDENGLISSDFMNEMPENQRNKGKILTETMSLSHDGSQFLISRKGNMRAVNMLTGITKELKLPDKFSVLSNSYSPDGRRVAVLAASGVETESATYKGFIYEIESGKIIAQNDISSDIFISSNSNKPELHWIGGNIFLPDSVVFDTKFLITKKIKGLFLPSAPQKQPFLFKPIINIKEDRTEFSSIALVDPFSLRTYSTVKLRGEDNGNGSAFPHYATPDGKLSPFDISPNRDSFVKPYLYWRAGGGIIYASSKTNFELPCDTVGLPTFSAFLPNGNIIYVQPADSGSESEIVVIDTNKPDQEKTKITVPIFSSVKMSLDRKILLGIQKSGCVVRYQIEGNTVIPVGQYLSNGINSLMITPEHFYLSQGNLSNLLRFTKRVESFPFEQFDLRLNRPDIVLKRFGAPAEAVVIAKQLRDKRLRRMNVTEDMLQPDFHVPEVRIDSEVPTTCDADYVNLSIKASDTRYSLDRLRIYVNNVPINGRDGELLRESKFQSLERTIKINLAAGRNKIQVSVLNSAGAESMYANAEVNCTASRPKPTLYAVAMGVSEYSNPEWNLKYAAKDAKDILDRIRLNSTSSFGEVKELLITDREVTKEILPKIKEFLSQAKIDDTVLIFVAGHGLLDSKYDYYFGTSDIDFENPSVKGIAFEEFDDLLAEMPSLRKSLLIDTCHAGELDEDEKKALAASQSAPSDQLIAMHPVGARGMSVKPIEGARGKSEWYDRLQGLFVDLRRGSGSTILSSSAGAEYALESSEQKNGLFTYAVLEALDGKEGSDSNKDGAVTMSELAEYVKKRVSTLTNSKQSPNVRRVNLECDFVLTKKSVESNPELPEKKATEVQPIKEGKIVDTYTCVITNKDRRNNSGIRLEDPVLILMQDRANVHKFGNPEKDSVDNFFSDATHRARIRSYIERGSFPANLQNAMKKDEAAGLQVSVLQDQNGKFSLQVSSAEVANKQQIAPQIKASLEQFEFIDSESNFRVGPGASYAIKYKPLKGTVGTLIQKNGQWIRIQLENGDSGWAHQQNLRIIR
jgi:uncharacterized protein YecT (DUF1311 family)